MKRELKTCRIDSKMNVLDKIDDPFVQVVVGLWKYNSRKGTLHYITDNDEIVSFILLEMNEQEWTIRGTWTSPNYRRQGLSNQLLRTITADFRYSGETCIWVNITPGAEELYKKNGFVIYGQRLDTDPPMSVGIYSLYFNTKYEKKLIREKFGDCFEWNEKD